MAIQGYVAYLTGVKNGQHSVGVDEASQFQAGPLRADAHTERRRQDQLGVEGDRAGSATTPMYDTPFTPGLPL